MDTIAETVTRYDELTKMLSDPKVVSNSALLQKLSRERAALADRYALAQEITDLNREIKETTQLIKDEKSQELLAFYADELAQNEATLNNLHSDFTELTRVTDPNDIRDSIVEIRAGAGGEEAALFAAELFRMYSRFAEKMNWKIELISDAPSDTGGFKEIIFFVRGESVYGKLKYESGVHRVQRVPATESSGRIHTSAASVVVMPEVDDVEIEVKDEDLKVDVYRSSGPGGQSVNTTDSAVRMTHVPTGIVVTCQDEKSQLKNRTKALKVLKSRLYDLETQKQMDEERDQRQSAIRGGDRSAKIRTYNFPQSRVTDHRIKKSWHNLSGILDGDLEDVITATSEELIKAQ
ncbi:MAG: peptide chain release factor 1 [Candidatus Dojkabacteria bacterium]